MASKTRHQSKEAESSRDHSSVPAGTELAVSSGILSPQTFSKQAQRFLVGYCFVAALSIAAAQIILLALIVYWLAVVWSGPAASRPTRDPRIVVFAAPLLNWFLVCLVTGMTGIDPVRSVGEAFKSSVFLLLPFAVYSSFTIVPLATREFLARIETCIAALIFSQCLAAIHTLFTELFPDLPSIVPGPLTESGQLVLVLPLVLASIFYAVAAGTPREQLGVSLFGRTISPQLNAGLLFVAFLFVAWPGAILWEESSVGTLMSRIVALVFALIVAIPPLRQGAPALQERFVAVSRALRFEVFHLIWPAAALLFAALLINLKRGPWLGVFVELIVLGYLLSKRLLFWSVALSFVLLLSLSPARTRMANLNEHFSISGGRKEMWELGEEIAQRYSLGLGVNNAQFMRELDPAIPQTHRHMHNNFLNVLVETGWIGLSVYVWWTLAVLGYGFRLWNHCRAAKDRVSRQVGVLALCLSLALLGWQVSGSVEYNFGDGEIRLIAFFYTGLLLALGSFTTFASPARTVLTSSNDEEHRYPTSKS